VGRLAHFERLATFSLVHFFPDLLRRPNDSLGDAARRDFLWRGAPFLRVGIIPKLNVSFAVG
jgi:hypothetical protein